MGLGLKASFHPVPLIMKRNALGLTSTPPFYQRLNGKVEPKVTEAEAIERIFAEYGITEVWGEA